MKKVIEACQKNDYRIPQVIGELFEKYGAGTVTLNIPQQRALLTVAHDLLETCKLKRQTGNGKAGEWAKNNAHYFATNHRGDANNAEYTAFRDKFSNIFASGDYNLSAISIMIEDMIKGLDSFSDLFAFRTIAVVLHSDVEVNDKITVNKMSAKWAQMISEVL